MKTKQKLKLNKKLNKRDQVQESNQNTKLVYILIQKSQWKT